MSKTVIAFRQFVDTGNWFVALDGKHITRKSIFTASVYSNPYDNKHPFVEYKSRIEHCGSCLADAEYGDGVLDQCCCIHAQFHNKKEENEYVKSIGFWKIPFKEQS